MFILQDKDETMIVDIGDVGLSEPTAQIEENQEVATISNEIEGVDIVDKTNVILDVESSMNDNENDDEGIGVDYQEENEDQENNYTDTDNVNVE